MSLVEMVVAVLGGKCNSPNPSVKVDVVGDSKRFRTTTTGEYLRQIKDEQRRMRDGGHRFNFWY